MRYARSITPHSVKVRNPYKFHFNLGDMILACATT